MEHCYISYPHKQITKDNRKASSLAMNHSHSQRSTVDISASLGEDPLIEKYLNW